jgi:hypothetical protein
MLYGAAAFAQSEETIAADHRTVQLAALDERIQMLVTDMNMFTGELKINAMATLLNAIVDRIQFADRLESTPHDLIGPAHRDAPEAYPAYEEDESWPDC